MQVPTAEQFLPKKSKKITIGGVSVAIGESKPIPSSSPTKNIAVKLLKLAENGGFIHDMENIDAKTDHSTNTSNN